jgi:hypothetical protein
VRRLNLKFSERDLDECNEIARNGANQSIGIAVI